jgi:putative membrane protein
MAMQRTSLSALLLSASLVAAPAFAQITVIPMPPAPQPFAAGPPLATGIPQTPLTAVDAAFLQAQLDGGMAEISLAQLALQKSQDQNVRNFAQKMITDHMAANAMMMQIADAYNVHASAALAPQAQALYDNLSTLNGVAFDTIYIDGMIRAHDAVIKELDTQQTKGQNPQINVWVQNTRPVVVQHEGIAQQIKANLPRSG